MSKRLQVTLYVIVAYLTVFGILFLFLPSVAEKVLGAVHVAVGRMIFSAAEMWRPFTLTA